MTTTLYTVPPITAYEVKGYTITQTGTVVDDADLWAVRSTALSAGIILNSTPGGAPQLVQVPSYYNGATGAPTNETLPVGTQVTDSAGATFEKHPDGTWGQVSLSAATAGPTALAALTDVNTTLTTSSTTPKVLSLDTDGVWKVQSLAMGKLASLSDVDTTGYATGCSLVLAADGKWRPSTALPTVPGSLHTTVVASGAVTLAWNASNGTGSAIRNYIVTNTTTSTTTTLSGTTLSTTITGLTNGTAYSFTVKAVNAVGNSAASSAVTVTPPGTTRSGLAWTSGIWPLARTGSTSSYNSALAYAEGQRGRPSDINMAAQYNNGSWGDLTGLQVLDFLNGTPTALPVIMLPPFVPGGTWAAAAAGTYDTYYQQIGARISTVRGSSRTALRFAWESNGNWYDWGIVNNSGGGATNFINGWRRAITQIRSGAGSNASAITVVYSLSNLDDKGQGDPLTVCYPGDAYVDQIGLDIYDRDNVTSSDTVPGWATVMQRGYDFAVAHGKKFSLDEWGLHHTGYSPEGGDNPHFINAMYTWIKAHESILGWEQYFQDDAAGNVNSSLFSSTANANPNSRTAYLAQIA